MIELDRQLIQLPRLLLHAAQALVQNSLFHAAVQGGLLQLGNYGGKGSQCCAKTGAIVTSLH